MSARPPFPINNNHIIVGNPAAHGIIKTLFKACGWKVVTHAPTPKPGKPKRKK